MQIILEATYRDGVLVLDRSLGPEQEGKKFKLIVVEEEESAVKGEFVSQERPAIPKNLITEFCRKHNIRRLSVFGSYLREDFGPGSDIDFLVEFEEGQTPGYFELAHMEEELSDLIGGRKVDLRTPHELSRYFRDEVMAEAEVQYAKG
jgi:predicted nucleotidyltransferase